MDTKHDETFADILQEQRQIVPFLDAVFGFLYRRTDFFIEKETPNSKVGFAPGLAVTVVRETFRKWQKLKSQENSPSPIENVLNNLVVHEEEVVTSDDVGQDAAILTTEQNVKSCESSRDVAPSSDSYNGADCGSYRWSQTETEVDVKVPIPSGVCRANDVKVKIGPSSLAVSMAAGTGQWTTIVEGELSHKHCLDECIWTLMPGSEISIHLEKASEKWWDSLLVTEQQLDLSQINATPRPLSDLRDEDHMAVEKVLMHDQRRHKEHQEQLGILEAAWNADGSPFLGTPFDPSILHLPP